MRKYPLNLLGTGLLCSGLGAAAHCPTHIINSSGKPWILASTHIQGYLKVTVLHNESGSSLANGIFSPAQGGYFIMPAHSIIGIETLGGAMTCEARFRLLDHTWQFPMDGEVIYEGPAASGDSQIQAGSLRYSAPEAEQGAASSAVREPTPVILQILRDQWNAQPAPVWSGDEEAAAQPRADSSASTSSSVEW